MNYTIMALLGAKDVGFGSVMARASASTRRFSKDVEGTANRTSKMGAGLKAAFAGLGAIAGAFFVNAISQAVQFETAMRNVNSIARLGTQDFAAMSNQVLNLSTRLPQSAKTLAEGLYDIVSSGFEGAGAMKVLEASATAASAGLTTTEVSARAISAAINAYGLSAADATDISDILFQTVNLGVVTFEQLASGLGNVVGSASSAGIELDEVGAAIAAMTLSGLGAEESITSLNRLIEKIVKPSDALANVFGNLGYESGKAALDANGLHGVMELLRRSTGGQVTELLKLFPEIRAARGAFALMAADGQNYQRTFDGIADANARAGATQAAFAEQTKAFSAQWKLFVNGFNAASIRIGTALLPALKSGLEGVSEFGSGFARVMTDLGTAAGPAIDQLGSALQEVGRLFGVVVDAVKPLAQILGVAFAAAAIAGLYAFSAALSAVAGVLADHPALIKAVAVVLGGILLSNLLTSAAAAAKFAVQFRALLVMETLGPLVAGLVGRLQALGGAILAIRLGDMTGGVNGLKSAFSGLSSVMSSPALAGTVLVAGLYAIQTGLSNAHAQAKEFISELDQGLDVKSVDSLQTKIVALRDRMSELNSQWEDMGGGGLGTIFKGTVELLTPMENKVLDNAVAFEDLEAAMQEAQATQGMLEHDIATLSNTLGVSQGTVAEFLNTFDSYDPTDTSQTTSDLAQSFREMAASASGAAPAAEELDSALATSGDLMSSAADKADAFKSSLDALFGTMLGASNASIAYQQAIDDLTTSFSENGNTLDINTEAGRSNASAINEAVSAAVDHAAAIVDSTGSMQQGVDTLGLYREQLLGQLESYGMTRAAAEEYVATLGLTPDNLTTLIELAGTAEATQAMGQVFDAINQLDLTVAEPEVRLDDLPFMDNAQAVGEFLVQVGKEAPSARVLLDDSQFVPTAAQVTSWTQTYDDASPEAQALLNIIDPQNNFSTLSAAAAGWDARSTTATAGLDTSPAAAAFAGAHARLSAWDASSGSATAGADDSPAQASIGRARGSLNAWGASRGTGIASLDDQASGPLGNISNYLDRINGRSVAATVRVSIQQSGRVRLPGSTNVPLRWGGIIAAQSGMSWDARVLSQPTVFAGERETGGEAFIPRKGDRGRSLGILATAAGWYGMSIVPKDAVAAQAGLLLGAAASDESAVDQTVRIERAVALLGNRIVESDNAHFPGLAKYLDVADTNDFYWLGGFLNAAVPRWLDVIENGIETLIRQNDLGPRNVRWFEDLASIPANRRFADGGTVPGRAGTPQLVLAHGGEQIYNRQQIRGMSTPTVVNYQLGGSQVVVTVKGDVVDAAKVDKRIASAVSMALDEDRRTTIRQLKVRR